MSREALDLRVLDVVQESADAQSLVLAPVSEQDGRPTYLPGQFLTLQIPTERAGGAARCYSISSCSHCDEPLKVTVKRTAGGFASNWLCDNVRAGDVLTALPPSGSFTPRVLDSDIVLIAAGSGITPVISILKAFLHTGTGQAVLLYANRDEASVIFRDELAALGRQHADRLAVVHWLESVQDRPTAAGLRALLAPYTARHAYLCGPTPFMEAAQTALRDAGMPHGQIHLERFTSLSGDPFAARPLPSVSAADVPVAQLEVTLDGATTHLAWPQDRVMLDVMLDAGLDAPYSCQEGSCSACACFVRDGEVELRRNEVLEAEDLADGIVLACQAVWRTEHVRVTYDG